MQPGPDRYVACPRCDAVARHETMLSGNTFGAVMWSDGREVAPMLPTPPSVVRCGNCAGCYWLRDAQEIGEFYGFEGEEGFPAECENAPWIEEPDHHEYLQLVRSGSTRNRDDERLLRILAWQKRNDSFRTSPDDFELGPPVGLAKPPPSVASVDAEYRENLEALLTLLDGDDEEGQLFRAAVLRMLGRFDEALSIINETQWDELSELAFQMGLWCKRRDPSLRAFELSPW